ncbi:cupin domain-containing protein [Nocardioides humi]|uniref:Cupin type-2 domain-containing protein n=1 Tax=Nocardioides humi TaxID=449461 RepID=A0ABN2BYK6_9ACTN|nr:cupin domain-containing protein [Nocardioides humi]
MSTKRPEEIWFAHYLARIHVDGSDSDGAFALTEMEAERFDGPMHVHDRESETFYVLEGSLTVHTDEVTVTLDPGDSFLTPRGTPHRYAVTSDRARWLMLSAPAGFENLIREAGVPAQSPTLPPPGVVPDAAANEGVSARHGVTYL